MNIYRLYLNFVASDDDKAMSVKTNKAAAPKPVRCPSIRLYEDHMSIEQLLKANSTPNTTSRRCGNNLSAPRVHNGHIYCKTCTGTCIVDGCCEAVVPFPGSLGGLCTECATCPRCRVVMYDERCGCSY